MTERYDAYAQGHLAGWQAGYAAGLLTREGFTTVNRNDLQLVVAGGAPDQAALDEAVRRLTRALNA